MEELQKAIQENIPESLQEEFNEYLNNPNLLDLAYSSASFIFSFQPHSA